MTIFRRYCDLWLTSIRINSSIRWFCIIFLWVICINPPPPPPCWLFFMFAPADDSLFILFKNLPGVWPYSTDIVLDEAPVSTLFPLDVYGLFALYQSPWCMFVMFTLAEDYLFVSFINDNTIHTVKPLYKHPMHHHT